MKVLDLYNHVAGLGFESSLEDDNRFYNAAERALLQVARIRPATRTYHINHKPMENEIKNSTLGTSVKAPGLVYYAEEAKAYYFEADGVGTAYVEYSEDGVYKIANVVSLDSNRTFRAYRGFVKNGNSFVNGAVRIRFEGEYLYNVRNAALYKYVYSQNEEDIPAHEPFTRYDMSVLASDFLSLASPPIVDGLQREILNQKYDVENECIILLPHNMNGEYGIRYIKCPQAIDTEANAIENEQEIDLASDLSMLLPNLVAAYILAEDEPQLAEYYLSLYNQQAAVIEAKTRYNTPAKIINNGW